MPWDHFKVSKIDFLAASGNCRAVIAGTEEGDVVVSRGFYHFIQGIVGMAAGDGVGVKVNEIVHVGGHFFLFYLFGVGGETWFGKCWLCDMGCVI